jgi:hypothetical protein
VRRITLARVATTAMAGAAAAVLALAGPAAAADPVTIPINPGNVPTTAKGGNDCDPNHGGGHYSDVDGWIFNLPSQGNDKGDFVAVTAQFSTDADDTTVEQTVTITAAANPGSFDNSGNNAAKAWIYVTKGWTLVGASAEVIGTTATQFVLTGTCGALPDANPTPTPTKTDSTGGGGDNQGGGDDNNPPGDDTTPTPEAHNDGGSLPVTGVALTGIITAGVLLVGGGAALEAQLGQQAGDVVLDRLLGEEHLRRDLPVGQAFGDVDQDAPLLLGQGLEFVGLFHTVADPLEDALRHRGVEHRLAGRDAAHRVDEVGAANLLQHVSGGPGHDGREQRLVILV